MTSGWLKALRRRSVTGLRPEAVLPLKIGGNGSCSGMSLARLGRGSDQKLAATLIATLAPAAGAWATWALLATGNRSSGGGGCSARRGRGPVASVGCGWSLARGAAGYTVGSRRGLRRQRARRDVRKVRGAGASGKGTKNPGGNSTSKLRGNQRRGSRLAIGRELVTWMAAGLSDDELPGLTVNSRGG